MQNIKKRVFKFLITGENETSEEIRMRITAGNQYCYELRYILSLEL
jgi:hypothetical protein